LLSLSLLLRSDAREDVRTDHAKTRQRPCRRKLSLPLRLAQARKLAGRCKLSRALLAREVAQSTRRLKLLPHPSKAELAEKARCARSRPGARKAELAQGLRRLKLVCTLLSKLTGNCVGSRATNRRLRKTSRSSPSTATTER